MAKGKYLTIRIDEDLRDRATEAARADGLTLSRAIEIFVTQYVAAAKKHRSADDLPGTILAKLLRK